VVSAATVVGTPTQLGTGLTTSFTGNALSGWVLNIGSKASSAFNVGFNGPAPYSDPVVVDGISYTIAGSAFSNANGLIDIVLQ